MDNYRNSSGNFYASYKNKLSEHSVNSYDRNYTEARPDLAKVIYCHNDIAYIKKPSFIYGLGLNGST